MLIAERVFITTQYLFLLAYFQLFEDENSDFMFASTSSTVPTVINKYSLNKGMFCNKNLYNTSKIEMA